MVVGPGNLALGECDGVELMIKHIIDINPSSLGMRVTVVEYQLGTGGVVIGFELEGVAVVAVLCASQVVGIDATRGGVVDWLLARPGYAPLAQQVVAQEINHDVVAVAIAVGPGE